MWAEREKSLIAATSARKRGDFGKGARKGYLHVTFMRGQDDKTERSAVASRENTLSTREPRMQV